MAAQQGWRFEDFIFRLFGRLGFEAQREIRAGPYKADLLIRTPPNGPTAVVEVKLYRFNRVARATIENLAAHLEEMRRYAQANKAILVISARLSPLVHAELKRLPNLIIYDRDRLSWLLLDHPDLASEFNEILGQSEIFVADEEEQAPPIETTDLHEALIETPRVEDRRPQPQRGAGLCKEIRKLADAISATPKDQKKALAEKFEDALVQAFKYLFSDEITGWSDELYTSAKISRFDLIGRIRSQGGFWRLLADRFNSLYVVFEFKLYKYKISQGQILTTEKYLYRSALRGVAIIVSPHGPDENATRMAHGALREHGKLILNITTDQICTMLHAKDGAVGPDEEEADIELELFKTLDDMLMRIER